MLVADLGLLTAVVPHITQEREVVFVSNDLAIRGSQVGAIEGRALRLAVCVAARVTPPIADW